MGGEYDSICARHGITERTRSVFCVLHSVFCVLCFVFCLICSNSTAITHHPARPMRYHSCARVERSRARYAGADGTPSRSSGRGAGWHCRYYHKPYAFFSPLYAMNICIKPFLFVSIPLAPVAQQIAEMEGSTPAANSLMPVERYTYLYMYTCVIPHTAVAACRYRQKYIYIWIPLPFRCCYCYGSVSLFLLPSLRLCSHCGYAVRRCRRPGRQTGRIRHATYRTRQQCNSPTNGSDAVAIVDRNCASHAPPPRKWLFISSFSCPRIYRPAVRSVQAGPFKPGFKQANTVCVAVGAGLCSCPIAAPLVPEFGRLQCNATWRGGMHPCLALSNHAFCTL